MNYRELDGVNQSCLKEILKHPQDFVRAKKRMEQPEDPNSIPPWFVFGSLVDHMLTEDTPVEDRFYTMKTKAPSEAIQAIVDGVFKDKETGKSLEEMGDTILLHCKYMGYGQKWKPETQIDKVVKGGSDYFKSLLESEGKIPVDQDTYFKATTCKMSLLTDQYTSKWLKPAENCEVIKKVALTWEWNGILCKGELDIVHINHELRQITPVDIKTMSGAISSFSYNFWKYRYDFQGSFYEAGLKYSDFKEVNNCPDYHVNPMVFLVAEKDSHNSPMVFTNAATRDIGAKGGEWNGRTYEGFIQAIERYKFHEKVDNWDYPQEYIEAEGEMLIV